MFRFTSRAEPTGLTESEAEQRFKEVSSIGVPPVIQKQERLILNDLQKMQLSDEKSVDLLIRHLAATQLLLNAEQTYRMIFGSQIVVLRHLNTYGPRTRSQIQAIYDQVKMKHPELYSDYPFQQYLAFLTSQRLIATEDQGETFQITDEGKEFLKWMTAASVLEEKPF